mmetsp:Transcript_35557/g.102214  ORF Transcript_35557/g.102214 Transcript_35557/m.102214 type:complete len:486 (+) Transcript_35557:830-2287(+)
MRLHHRVGVEGCVGEARHLCDQPAARVRDHLRVAETVDQAHASSHVGPRAALDGRGLEVLPLEGRSVEDEGGARCREAQHALLAEVAEFGQFVIDYSRRAHAHRRRRPVAVVGGSGRGRRVFDQGVVSGQRKRQGVPRGVGALTDRGDGRRYRGKRLAQAPEVAAADRESAAADAHVLLQRREAVHGIAEADAMQARRGMVAVHEGLLEVLEGHLRVSGLPVREPDNMPGQAGPRVQAPCCRLERWLEEGAAGSPQDGILHGLHGLLRGGGPAEHPRLLGEGGGREDVERVQAGVLLDEGGGTSRRGIKTRHRTDVHVAGPHAARGVQDQHDVAGLLALPLPRRRVSPAMQQMRPQRRERIGALALLVVPPLLLGAGAGALGDAEEMRRRPLLGQAGGDQRGRQGVVVVDDDLVAVLLQPLGALGAMPVSAGSALPRAPEVRALGVVVLAARALQVGPALLAIVHGVVKHPRLGHLFVPDGTFGA